MLLIVCVDDNMGMAFNHRRQSQDRLLRRRLLERVGASKLWMSPYTARQFDALPENVQVSETFLSEAEAGEYCFAELSCPDDAEGVVLYRWNRSYPADVHFPIDFSGWKLVQAEEFAGSSHEKITEEIYERVK